MPDGRELPPYPICKVESLIRKKKKIIVLVAKNEKKHVMTDIL
jgi:hypothetical protein